MFGSEAVKATPPPPKSCRGAGCGRGGGGGGDGDAGDSRRAHTPRLSAIWVHNDRRRSAERIAGDEQASAEFKAVCAMKTRGEEVCSRETAEGYLQPGESELDMNTLQNRYEKAKRMVEKESRRHARPQEECGRWLIPGGIQAPELTRWNAPPP